MTDRHQGYIVILDKDIREDDSEALMTALRMVRGVISVQPVVANGADLIAQARETERWRNALVTLIQYGPDSITDPRKQQG